MVRLIEFCILIEDGLKVGGEEEEGRKERRGSRITKPLL